MKLAELSNATTIQAKEYGAICPIISVGCSSFNYQRTVVSESVFKISFNFLITKLTKVTFCKAPLKSAYVIIKMFARIAFYYYTLLFCTKQYWAPADIFGIVQEQINPSLIIGTMATSQYHCYSYN